MSSSCASLVAESIAAAAALSVSNLNWSSGGAFRLRDIGFTVEAGAGLAVIGANGAGKSSLLRLLSGLTRPDRGEIRIAGRPVANWGDVSRFVGFVQQRKELPDNFTVREYVLQQAQLRRAPSRICDELLDFAGLAQHSRVRATELSGGNKRKLQILCAVIHHPAVLIADEPGSEVDPAFHCDVMNYLANLKRETGLALVVATHRLDEVIALTDRVAAMCEGRFAGIETLAQMRRTLAGQEALRLRLAPDSDAACAQAAISGLACVCELDRDGVEFIVRPVAGAGGALLEIVQCLAARDVSLRAIGWEEPGLAELIRAIRPAATARGEEGAP